MAQPRVVPFRLVLAPLILGVLACACTDRRVVTEIDVEVSIADDDGTPLDVASVPTSDLVLRTRNECVDGHVTLCICDNGADSALVRLVLLVRVGN